MSDEAKKHTKVGSALVDAVKPKASTRRRMRKAGHNFVAILMTVILAVWQTPAVAFAGAEEDAAAPVTEQVQAQAQEAEEPVEEAPQTPEPEFVPEPEPQPVAEPDAEPAPAQEPDEASDPAGEEPAAPQEEEEVPAATDPETSEQQPEAMPADEATEGLEGEEGELVQPEEEIVEPVLYTITFDANGGWPRNGSVKPIKDIKEDIDTVKLPKRPFEREGYTFAGWNLVPDPSLPGTDRRKAQFIPDGVELFNLSYSYVVLTEDNASESELKSAIENSFGAKVKVVGDTDAARGHDSKGREVITCDMRSLAKNNNLTLYAQWKEIPKEESESEENDEGSSEDADTDDDSDADDQSADTQEDGSNVPEYEREIFDTENPGNNTVNADGTVTDADGYNWYVAPDDELDESGETGEIGEPVEGDENANPGEVTDSGLGDEEATAALDRAEELLEGKGEPQGFDLLGLLLFGQSEDEEGEGEEDEDGEEAAEGDENEGDGTKIEAIRVKWITGDTAGSAYTDDALRLSLVPGDDSPQAMKFQVEFSLSGQYDYEPGDVEFSIPATIWKDRNGNPVGYMTLSVPEDPETGADFAYRLVNGNYVITNVHRLSAASKAAFQFTVRGITPHTVVDAVIPVANYTGDLSGKTIMTINGVECVVDNNVSAKIQPTIKVRTHEGHTLSLTSTDAIDATIDTSERITSATKSGELFETRPSGLPAQLLANLPAGTETDDYLFVRWQTYSYHQGNQVFTIDLDDGLQQSQEVIRSDGGSTSRVPFEDEGIILGGVNTNGQVVGEVSADGRSIDFGTIYGPDYHADTTYLYDHLNYVWSAYPKYREVTDETGETTRVDRYEHGHVYEFKNRADWDLTGYDDGILTEKNPVATVTYAPQKFHAPIGDYAMYKYTESSYKDYTYGYYLDQLRSGKAVSMNFRVATNGHPFSWTLGYDDEGNPLNPDDINSYGKRAITFETFDDDTFFNYDWETPITHEDFEFVSLRFNSPNVYNYGKRANGTWDYIGTSDVTMKPDIDVYGQVAEGDEWVKFATISWNGNTRAYNGASVSGTTVTFPSNVSDVKHIFSTTAAGIYVDAYPVIRLKPSPRVVQLVEQLYEESEYPTTKFQNNAHLTVSYEDSGEFIGDFADQSRATLTGTTLAISSDKNVNFNAAVDNDLVNQRVTLHYKAKVYEQTNIESRTQYDEAVAAGILPSETSGTFYDLLPKGVIPNLDSVKLRNGDSIKDVYTIEDYKGSGRILMVVKAELSPHPTAINRKYADVPELSFDAWYAWENIKDLGLTLVNRIAYESGIPEDESFGSTAILGEFGNVHNHMGEKDDPTGVNGYLNNQTRDAVGEDAELLKDLDPDTDKGSFVYAKCTYTIDPDLRTRTSISKYVMDDSKGRWTQGLDQQEQVTVYPGHPYTYRLRVEADSASATKDIILYDSIENYIPSAADKDEKGQQWRGVFRYVDVSQLVQVGVKPVVYYSTVPHLRFEDSVDDAGRDEMSMDTLVGYYDIHNSSYWSTTPPANLADVTAIAIDASKKADGSDFVLGTYLNSDGELVEDTDSIQALIHMVAPVDEGLLYGDGTGIGSDTWASGGANAVFAEGDAKFDAANNRYAFNNTRLVCKQGPGGIFDEGTDSSHQMIRNDYTRVGILPFEMTIKKLWNDSDDNDGKRPDSVTINLLSSWYDSNGNATTGEAEYADPTAGPNGDGKVGPITLTPNEDGEWVAHVERIKYVNDEVNYVPLHYSLTEDTIQVPALDQYGNPKLDEEGNPIMEQPYHFSVQQGNRDVSGALIDNEANYLTIINTHPLDKTKVSGKKVWNDDADAAGMRPASITVKLYADGRLVNTKQVTAGDAGDWSYSFGELNRYKRVQVTGEDGITYSQAVPIIYTVEEDYVPKYVQDTEASSGFELLVNDYHPLGDLAIQKSLVDATELAAQKDFTFTVLLTREKANPDDDPMPVDGEFAYTVVDAESGEAVLDDEGNELGGIIRSGGTLTLKGGQRAVIRDLPSECTYEVVETQPDGYTQTSATNTRGTIRAGQTAEVGFQNTYAATGSVQLGATKQLLGHPLARYQFRFRITDSYEAAVAASDDYLRAAANNEPGEDGTGEVQFGAIRYTQADAGQTYTYYLYEVDSEKPGYTYDDSIFKVEVAVTDNGDGTLTCEPTYFKQARDEEGNVIEGEWEPLQVAAEPADGETIEPGEGDGGATPSEGEGEPVEPSAQEDALEVPVFHNEYHASGKLQLKAWKALEGRALQEGEFSFQLRDGDTGEVLWLDPVKGEAGEFNIVDAHGSEGPGETQPPEGEGTEPGEGEGTEPGEGEVAQPSSVVEQEKSNTADGSVVFDEIVWDQSVLMEIDEETGEVTYLDKKVYLFTVNEVAGLDPTVVYDRSFKGYLVTVFDNGDGTLGVAQSNVDVSGLYTVCAICDGTGLAHCPHCSGNGIYAYGYTVVKPDGSRHGSGNPDVKCDACFGSGLIKQVNGESVACSVCSGTGLSLDKFLDHANYIHRFNDSMDEYLVATYELDAPNEAIGIDKPYYKVIDESGEWIRCLYGSGAYHDCDDCDNVGFTECDGEDGCGGVGVVRNPDWSIEDAEEAGIPLFTNTLNPGNLALTKTIQGDEGNPNQLFKFRIKFTGDEKNSEAIEEAMDNATLSYGGAASPAPADEGASSDGDAAQAAGLEASPEAAQLQAADNPMAIPADPVSEASVAPAQPSATEGTAAESSHPDASGPGIAADFSNVLMMGIGGFLSLIPAEKAYADETIPTPFRVSDDDPMMAGRAYAVLTDDTDERGENHFIFFRSHNTYSAGEGQSVVDIMGNTYKGKIYTDVETNTTFRSWGNDRRRMKSVSIADGQAVKMNKTMYCIFSGCTAETIDLARMDTSTVTDMYAAFEECANVRNLDLSTWDTSSVTRVNGMFRRCASLEHLNVAGWNMDKCTDISQMLHTCRALKTVDMTGWSLPIARDVYEVFRNCENLEVIEGINGWNPKNTTSLYGLFCECKKLRELDLSGWQTSKVTSLRQTFNNCTSLTTLDASDWDVSAVTNMAETFRNCSSLTTLDVTGMDTRSATTMASMFYGCSQLTELDVSSFNTAKVTDMSSMFGGCSRLRDLDVSGWDTGKVTTMASMFSTCRGLQSIDVSHFDTKNVTTMRQMFAWCSGLTSLDLSSWDTSKVTTTAMMFYLDHALASVDFSGWDTSSLTTTTEMFRQCRALRDIDFTGWNTSNVTDMSYMFAECSGIQDIDLTMFDTSNVTKLNHIFYSCSSLKNPDISTWRTPNVKDIGYLFYGCTSLKSLDLSNLESPDATSIAYMFYNCNNLESLDISNLSTQNAPIHYSIFERCNKLAEVKMGEDFDFIDTTMQLPKPPTNATYTGMWIRDDEGAGPYAPADFVTLYDRTSQSGTWVWEETFKDAVFSFDAGEGGAGSMVNARVSAANGGELPANQLYQFNKVFTGWQDEEGNFYQADENGVAIIPGGRYPASRTPVKLTAVWADAKSITSLGDGEYEVTIPGNSTLLVPGLPASTAYQIYEETPTGWILVSEVDAAGSIPSLDTAHAYFTNTYEPGAAQAQLYATKTLDGQPVVEGAFSFELRDQNGNLLETVSNAAGGFVHFSTIDYDENSVPEGQSEMVYTYTINEVVDESAEGYDSSINYDTHFETVTVTVTKDVVDGLYVMSAHTAYDPDDETPGHAAFANTTKPGELALTKAVQDMSSDMAEGGEGPDFEFTVRFHNEYGQPVDASSVQYYKTGGAAGASEENTDAADEPDNAAASNSSLDDEGDSAGGTSSASAPDASDAAAAFNPVAAGFGALLSLIPTQKAYADEVVPSASSHGFHVADLFDGDEQAAEEYLATTSAYAVQTADNELIFFRSAERYANGTVGGPFVDVAGNEYNGKVFADFEHRDFTSSSQIPWYWDRANTKHIRIAEGQAIRPQCLAYWFSDHFTVTDVLSLDVTGLDTSKANSMRFAFYGLSSIPSLDVSGFDTSNVQDMAYAFSSLRSVTELDVSGFDTSKVTDMDNMFSFCTQLTALDLSGFDFTQVTSTVRMFYDDEKLREIVLKDKQAPALQTMRGMFGACRALTNLDMSGLYAPNVTNISTLFEGANALSTVNMSNVDWSSVTSLASLFSNHSALRSVDLSNMKASSNTSTTSMFSSCSRLESVSLEGFDTSSVTSMSSMFNGCRALTSLDCSSFDTSNVTTTSWMFGWCSQLSNLNLGSWDTSSLRDMSDMFYGAGITGYLDLGSWDTSNVVDMSGSFASTKLSGINLSSFNTENVTNMISMFSGSEKLESLDVSSFNTRSIRALGGSTGIDCMFYGNKSLTSLTLGENFDVSDYPSCTRVFEGCTSLEELDISMWDTRNVGNLSDLFKNCPVLKKVTLGEAFSFKGSGNLGCVLPTPTGSVYSGEWERIGGGDSMTPQELADSYDGSYADTWVWALKDTVYTVLLEPGAGSVENQRLYGQVNSGVTLPVPVRPGYAFDGWNTAEDGSGVMFAAGSGRRVSDEAGTVTTLYAQYSLDPSISYTVMHNHQTIDGASYVVAEQFSGSDISDPSKLNAKEYPGFKLNADLTTSELSGDGTHYTINYYYDRTHYTVVFDPNGGSGSMEPLAMVGAASKTLPANTFTNGDSAFVGWNTAADGSGTQYVDTARVSNLTSEDGGTVTLYAQWATLEAPEGDPTTGEFTVRLKAGETAHFINLPPGTTYEIVEGKTVGEGEEASFVEGALPDGWSQVSIEGAEGTIVAAEISESTFTNTYKATGFAALEAHKLLVGDTPQAGQFSFELRDADGNLLQVKTNSSIDGNEDVVDPETGESSANPNYGTAPVRFDEIDFDKAGTYTFTITEIAGDDPAISYDGGTITAIVQMVDNNQGHLVPSVSYARGGVDGSPLGISIGATSSNIFTNTVNPGSLSLSKQVVNATAANEDAVFTFKLALSDKNGHPLANQTYTSVVGDTDGSAVVTDAQGVATIQLKGGEVAVINGLPHGATYTITEVEGTAGEDASEGMPAGFENTSAEGDAGAIEANQTKNASFTNTYEATGSIKLAALKNLTGRDLVAGEFTFELRNANGDVIQSQVNDADGKVAFDDLEYTLSQVLRDVEEGVATPVAGEDGKVASWTYIYSIDEYLPSGGDTVRIDGVLYDAHIEDVEVTVVDNGDGTLGVSAEYSYTTTDENGNVTRHVRGSGEDEYEGAAAFANDYDETSVVTELEFIKHFNGSASAEFSFRLEPVELDSGGKPVKGGDKAFKTTEEDKAGIKAMTAQNGSFADGKAKVVFEDIGPYKTDGDYYYLVYESDASGMIPDEAQYLVHVPVKQGVVQKPVYTMYYPDGDGGWEDLGAIDKPDFFNNDSSLGMSFSTEALGAQVQDAATVSVYPKAEKLLNGDTAQLVGGDFAFELRDADGLLLARATNDEHGEVAFYDERTSTGLVYNAPGTWAYTIAEAIPEGATEGKDGTWEYGGMSYDGTTWTMTVAVSEEPDGSLSAAVSYHDGASQGDVAIFENETEGYDLEVYKVSRSDGKGLGGCTYALWMVGQAGDVMIQEATSDETGRILFENVVLLRGQNYYFKEVEAPSGHALDPYRTAYFTLNEAGDGTVLTEETTADGWHSKYEG